MYPLLPPPPPQQYLQKRLHHLGKGHVEAVAPADGIAGVDQELLDGNHLPHDEDDDDDDDDDNDDNDDDECWWIMMNDDEWLAGES